MQKVKREDNTSPAKGKVAIVTGANRGIGREVAKELAALGYWVILTSRSEARGKQAALELGQELGAKRPGKIMYHQLDVTDAASIARLRDFVVKNYRAADALINNAAVLLDQNGRILQTAPDIFRATLEANVYGPLLLCQAFLPLMLEQKYGRVVNVSSGAGQISSMVDDMTAYRLSKIALNGLTLMLADSVKETNVLVNAACPGWVRTDMGSPNAPRSVEEGASGIVWLATLPNGGPHGCFFRDMQPLPW